MGWARAGARARERRKETEKGQGRGVGRVRDLMAEVIGVGNALGYDIEDSFVQKQMDVTYPMGAYRPSSMIDFVEGRAVEVEAIWGEPVRRAKAVGLEVPLMEGLLGEIEEAIGGR